MARKTDIRLRRSAVSGSIPTTSNLNLGELALNTADGKVYMKKSVGGVDSIVEVGSGAGISASFDAYEYSSSSNQTTFSGTDNNGNTLAYNTGSPSKVQVYMNGILLDEGSSNDYTATNGTSVVLTSAATTGDIIQIHAYKSDINIVNDLSFEDNQKLKLGDNDDLKLYHSGNHSYVQADGTGDLYIENLTQDEDIIMRINDGGSMKTMIFMDGNTALTKFQESTRHKDGKNAGFGDSDDLMLYHNGTNSFIKNATNDLYILNEANDKDIIFQADNGSGGNATYFYLDGSGTRTIFEQHTRHMDNIYSAFGTDADLRLYHDGTNSKIQQTSGATGDLIIEQAVNDKDISFRSDDGSGGVAEYFRLDGGNGYLITSKHNQHLDNVKSMYGASNDLQIFHDGTDSIIKEIGTGSLYIGSDGAGVNIYNPSNNEIMAKFNADSDVELYYNNAQKLATTSTGIDVTGTTTTDGLNVSGAGTIINSGVNGGTALTVKGESGNGLKTRYIFESGTNQYNWQLGFATHASQTFSLTPSTAANGTTFSNPVLNINQSGAATFSGDISASGYSGSNTLTITKPQVTSSFATTPAIRVHPSSTTDSGGRSALFLGTSTVDNYGISLRGARLGTNGNPTFELAVHQNSGDGLVALSIDTNRNASFSHNVQMGSGNATGKFAVQSSTVHGSYDFYNNGTSYFNGSVVVDDVLDLTGANRKLNIAGTTVIDASRNLTNIGNITSSGNVTIAGNLTVNGSSTTINTATLQVEDKDIVLNYGSGDTSATADGAGIIIQDAVNSSTNAAIQWNTGNDRFNFTHGIRLPDSQKMQFGTGSDLEIYHDGLHSFVKDAGTGNLKILADNLLLQRADQSQTYIQALTGGAVDLRYAGEAKLATTSSGINVTGTTVTDGLTVDGETFSSNGTYGTKLTYSNGNQSGVIDTFGNHNLEFRANNDRAMNIASNGDISFYDDTGSSQAFFWDASAEALGIGTTSIRSNYSLDVRNAGNSGVNIQAGDEAADIALSVGSAGTPDKFVITSGGSVGIGTTSPEEKLQLLSSGNTLIRVTSGTSSIAGIDFGDNADTDVGRIRYLNSSNALQFSTQATERMRIDSSGNLLVGTTSVSNAGKITVDGGTNGNGIYAVTDASAGYAGAVIERSASDGDLIIFKKSTAAVGTIGTNSGYLYLGSTVGTDAHILIGNNLIHPATSTGSGKDAAIVIGSATNRFKDLYLSGTANVASVNMTGALIDSAVNRGIKFDSASMKPSNGSGGDADNHIDLGTTSTRFKDLHLSGTINLSTADNASNAEIFVSPSTDFAYFDHPSNGMIFRNTSGAERMRIDSSGNVGIGTNNPLQALHIGSSGHLLFERGGELRSKDTSGNQKTIARVDSSNRLQFGWSGNGGVLFMGGGSYTERMRIHTNGNIGIGTTSPSVPLSVVGDIQTSTKLITKTTNGEVLRFERASDSLRYNSITSNALDGGEAFISFKVHDGVSATSQADVLHLKGNGNVGIGTTSPSEILTLDDTHPKLALRDAGIERAFLEVDSADNFVINNKSISSMIFETSDTERMRLDSSGRLGIGTSSPTHLIHVNGTTATILAQSTNAGSNASIWFNSNVGGTQANRWEVGTYISAGSSF